MSEISSVFVNDFKAALNGAKGEVDAWLECYNEAEVKAAINGLVAEKDAEILEQCRINGMGAEREATLLGKVERQSAALKLAREALFDMQDSYAAVHGWKDSFVIAATTALAAIDSLQKGE